MQALVVAERERGGAYRDLAELASRSGAGRDEPRAARLGGRLRRHRRGAGGDRPRGPLWRVGVAGGGRRRRAAAPLPLPMPEPPRLGRAEPWERVIADYAPTGMTLDEHPIDAAPRRASTRH